MSNLKLEALVNGKKSTIYKDKKFKDGETIRLGIQQTIDDAQTIIFDTTITAEGQVTPPPVDHGCKATEHWDEDLQKCVTNENHAPKSQDFTVESLINTDIEIALQGNDADFADVLTFIINKEPEHGTLSALNGNKVVYTPVKDYEGADAFNYSSYDQKVNSNVATVTINVHKEAPPPPPQDTEEGTTLWESKVWNNGNARTIQGVSGDPDDKDKQYECRAGQAVGGKKELVIDGKGGAKMTGERYRIYAWNEPGHAMSQGGAE